MTWKKIIKQPQVEEPPKEEFDRTTVVSQTQGMAIGQFKELVEEIIQLSAQARKDAANQRDYLGKIRGKIQDAGIPVVRE